MVVDVNAVVGAALAITHAEFTKEVQRWLLCYMSERSFEPRVPSDGDNGVNKRKSPKTPCVQVCSRHALDQQDTYPHSIQLDC